MNRAGVRRLRGVMLRRHMKETSAIVAGILVLGTGLTVLALYATPTPELLGPDFAVSSSVYADAAVQVVRDADGDFVVTWHDARGDTGGVDTYARRFDASGEPLGDEFKVNTSSERFEFLPRIAISAAGAFVVVWSGITDDNVFQGNRGQRYDAAGQPAGGQFQINTSPPVTTPNTIGSPSVAMAADGRFVVVWSENDYAYARLYDTVGQAVGNPLLVCDICGGQPQAVAMAADGAFVVAWARFVGSPMGTRIMAQRYTAAGAPLGEFLEVERDVDPEAGPSYLPAIAMDADGDFVVAWIRDKESSSLEDQLLNARAYDRLGLALGPVFAVSTAQEPVLFDAGLALDSLGHFVVSWASPEGTIFTRRYDSLGVGRGDILALGSNATFAAVSVGVDADGDASLVWGDGAIRAQRLAGWRELDLGVTVTGADVVEQGAGLDYTVRVRNREPSSSSTGIAQIDAAIGTATTVAVDIGLPANASFAGFDAPGWTCSQGGLTARCTLDGKLPAQAASDIVVQLTAAAEDGYVTLGASVDADQSDVVDTANNADAATTAVGAAADITPDPFGFAEQTDVARGATITSETAMIAGIDAPVSIQVVGGSYSLDCSGAFTSSAGTIASGQTVCVRHTSGADFDTNTDTVLSIGGASEMFRSTTLPRDTTPDPFSFTDRGDVEPLAEVVSDAVVVSGINDATSVRVGGGEYSLNGGDFTESPAVVVEGDIVRVRHTAAGAHQASIDTTLVIGGGSDVFTSTTRAAPGGGGAIAWSWLAIVSLALFARRRRKREAL